MSELFSVRSSFGKYEVFLFDLKNQVKKLNDKNAFIIIDEKVLELYPFFSSKRLIKLPADENSKTLDFASYLIESLRKLGANRNSHIIAIGGGIIQDLATIVASLYMRGISWSYLPTTLLAMVDSCLGGKSSINVGAFKNIAGNFFPPQKILIDPNFCKTLEHMDIVSGLCEAVKICYASSEGVFEKIISNLSVENIFTTENFTSIISLSLSTKKTFIEQDEFDQGIRLHLNFGHTFGHAIEAASKFAIPHGIAVGVGMQFAIHLAQTLSPKATSCERCILLNNIIKKLLIKTPLFLEMLKKIEIDNLFEKFVIDKKHSKSDFVLILPNEEGFLERKLISKNNLSEKFFAQTFTIFINKNYEIQ